jgi:hypothetical protein
MGETLLERISNNWKLVKKYEGKKVKGKRGFLKLFHTMAREIRINLKAYVGHREGRIFLVDDENPYRMNVSYFLYSIDEEGRLIIEPEIAKKVADVQSWLLEQRNHYDRMIETFQKFLEQLKATSKDYIVREKNTKWMSSVFQELSYKFTKSGLL